MDDLLALLERYAPGYRGTIQGARFWQLDVLEEGFGRPLPGAYRAFAETMGVDGGALLAHVRSYHPNHISELYAVAPVMPPRRFLFIFGDPSMEAYHYFLDLETSRDGDDHEVVRFPFSDHGWANPTPRFVSLREMLLVWAMRYVALPTFPHAATFTGSGEAHTPSAEDMANLFARLGFVKLSRPTRCMLFERADAAIELYRFPYEPSFSFQVGMRDLAELHRFEAIIEDTTVLVRT
jgi:hypothetical protein